MKAKFAMLLAASLVAGGAFAQTTAPLAGTAAAPVNSAGPTEPAGAAQGRTPTSVNTPQIGPKMASPKGAIDKGVVSTPQDVQGSTTTAPENVMRHDNKVQHTRAPRNGMGHTTHKKSMEKVNKPEPAVTLTTPAPGPIKTTPNATPTGGTPTAK